MKKILFILVSFFSVCSYGQKHTVSQKDGILVSVDSLLRLNNEWLDQIETDLSLKQRYKLYQTENIYTFLKLDTKTGKVDQVQWSLEPENEGSIPINDVDLSFGTGSGTFELYPTKNMYQFLLLDKTSGRMWHIQWGMTKSKRWITRLY